MTEKETKLSISKSARFYTHGNSKNPREIWMVLHGYGQLAQYFIKNFTHLNPERYFIVSPEGLHRFYLNGFEGRVGASWMTKEARLDDINDYVEFLNRIAHETIWPLLNPDTIFTVFGFSQGVATASRWIAYGNSKPQRAIFWAGSFPPDLEPVKAQKSFQNLKAYCCIGDNDPFVSTHQVEETKKHLAAINLPAQWMEYHGKHQIPKEELNRIIKNIEL